MIFVLPKKHDVKQIAEEQTAMHTQSKKVQSYLTVWHIQLVLKTLFHSEDKNSHGLHH